MEKNILFLCTGNSCRSQMAEGLSKFYWPSLNVFSAGTHPSSNVDPLAIEVMAEYGIDISEAQPKNIVDLPVETFDLVITLCSGAKESCPVFSGGAIIRHHGFDDPPSLIQNAKTHDECLVHYRRVRDEIASFIRELPLLYSFIFNNN